MYAIRSYYVEAVTLDGSADRLRDIHRTLLVAALEQDREFVAAQPGQQIARADAGLDQFRQLAQQFVARGVTERVVDHLELIEIDIEQCVRASRP